MRFPRAACCIVITAALFCFCVSPSVASPTVAAAPRPAPPPAEPAPTADAARAAFDWPLHPRPRVTRAFDKPDRNWLPGHRGVDLAAAPGQPVLAAGPGTVVFAGSVAGKPVVSVDHPGGLRTTYEPVDASVTAGRRVERGTVLGTVAPGHPECAATACLHWGLRRDREYLDPLPLVRAVPIRLLPTAAGQARG
ncbi:M23 family metallopeptidase [Rhodococcus sp. AG1013]|uniref:M23 family metallopeptidase n=1 Tax=unclassified Rhodococcus (in: high G+C Gram-positive bacteria) TaxID=192944 RepID=UPI000E0B2916|nr:M23 family metallopeptidase [Rhodococcus sp. AG1013]RDI31344.1 peptidase M23-like protein [Rhodococcus sp. AG1013]